LTQLKKILYLEDDFMTRDIVKRFLHRTYIIDMAENGEAAIIMTRKNNYDCFLIDIGLNGGLNGIEVTKELKKIKDNKNKPFIAVTGYAMRKEKEYILNSGLTHYISKPFNSRELLDLLESTIGH
jgi:DNA-binding response OmpR family regulator